MSRVSLILTNEPGAESPAVSPSAYRRALEAAGHWVELREDAGVEDQTCSAFAGLAAATGEILVVLDSGMSYSPADLVRVVATLDREETDLVVASRLTREAGGVRRAVGLLVRWWTGSSDPLTGLIALTRSAYENVAPRLVPVGSRFAAELIIKGEGCRILDVPVRNDEPSNRPRPGWNDLRHFKRLSDYRFGTFSRLVQFCFVGLSGMLIDLTAYFVLQPQFAKIPALSDQVVTPTKIPAALAASRLTAILIAMVWNFILNRRLTFSDTRGGSVIRQFLTYAAGNSVGIFVSLALSLGLPRRVGFFHDHKLAAAVVGIVAGTFISFTTARWLVFRRKTIVPENPGSSPAATKSTQPVDVRSFIP